MTTVVEHYDQHLAPYYSWLFGDFNAKVAANREFFISHGVVPKRSGVAVDLGAGSGFQSIALAEIGFKVTAIDVSQKLLDELKRNSESLAIETICDDLLNFTKHSSGRLELCVCMGDTLTHLDSFRKVKYACKKVYQALEAGGKFVLNFRDLTVELEGLERFIPVRSDANTVFSCFLEYEKQHVRVNDLIYTRNNDEWELHKSYYRKLRISMTWIAQGLKGTGFALDLCENKDGMITIIASKPQM